MAADTLRDILLQMSDRQIDRTMHSYISKWDDEPTALQILEVLDWCIHGSLASGFVVAALQAYYDVALKKEGKNARGHGLACNVERPTWQVT